MSDIKTKENYTKDKPQNISKDIMKGVLLKQKAKKAEDTPEVEAAGTVEAAVVYSADTLYQEGKYVVYKNRAYSENSQTVKNPAEPQHKIDIKTKEKYLRDKAAPAVKTREGYAAKASEMKTAESSLTTDSPYTSKQPHRLHSINPVDAARRGYVEKKLKSEAARKRTELVSANDFAVEAADKDNFAVYGNYPEIVEAPDLINPSYTENNGESVNVPSVKINNENAGSVRSAAPKQGQSLTEKATQSGASLKTRASYLQKQEHHKLTPDKNAADIKSVNSWNVSNVNSSVSAKTNYSATAKEKSHTLKQHNFKTSHTIEKRRKSAQQAAHSAQTAKKTVTAAKRAKKAVELAAHGVKTVISAIAAIGGGAAVLVSLIIIILVAAVAASPFGILISEEANDGIPLSEIREECYAELDEKIEDIKTSIVYDEFYQSGDSADWNEVMAVFAVKIGSGDNPEDAVVFDETKKEKLKAVFWDMNKIEYRTETVSESEDSSETVLYVEVISKSAETMAREYGFTQEQREMVTELNSYQKNTSKIAKLNNIYFTIFIAFDCFQHYEICCLYIA